MDKEVAQWILWASGGLITLTTIIVAGVSLDPTVPAIPINIITVAALFISMIWTSLIVIKAVK